MKGPEVPSNSNNDDQTADAWQLGGNTWALDTIPDKSDKTPEKQLDMVISLFNNSLYALDAEMTDHHPIKELKAIQEDQSATPMARLIAENLLEKWYNPDLSSENNFEENEVSLNDVDEQEYANEELRGVAYEYIGDEADFLTVYRIAPDTVGILESGESWIDDYNLRANFGFIANKNEISYAKDPDNHNQELDKQAVSLLSMAHNPVFRTLIEAKLDLKLSDVSLPAQIQLLKYMTEAGDKRFDKLCSVMHNTDENMRLKLAEGFLAVDFGEDFGDSLLAIAESKCYSKEQISEILDKIGSCRDSIKKITEFYKGFDGGKFVDEYTRAANERLTDVLTVFDKIGKNGSTEADLDWAGKIRYTYESAMEALAYEAKSLEIIGGTLGDLENGVDGAFAETVLPHDDSSARTSRTLYNLYSPNYGYVLLYTRPEGAHSFDPMLEYGKERSRYNTTTSNAGVEASISMIANPVDPFALPKPFRPDRRALKNLNFYDPETMDKVSAIRLDREGRVPGAPADDPNRDPTHQIGVVSVDLAAIGDRVDTPSGKISRLVSAGNKLRSQRMGESATFLNHNTNWFSQEEYGTADGFRRLVSYVDSLVLNWCKEHKPEDSVDSFHKRMRQVQKARGRKASKAVA